MKETVRWMAGKGNQEDECDAIQDAEHDGSPNTPYESVGQRAGDAPVEAENRDLDQRRADYVVDLNCERDLEPGQYSMD